MKRRLFGLLLSLTGLALVILEIAWTTRDAGHPLPLPPLALNAAVFIIGLAGLGAVYAGLRMIAGK